MDLDMTCATCSKKVDGSEEAGGYYYCCGGHYCNQACLDKSFDGTGTTWDEHYSDDGECYWTTREVA